MAKEPGPRVCRSHGTLVKLFRRKPMNMCKDCLAATALHQTPLTAANYCATEWLTDQCVDLRVRVSVLEKKIDKIVKKGLPR